MLSRKTKRFILIIFLAVSIFQLWWIFIGPGKGLFSNLQNRYSQIPSWPSALASYKIESVSPQLQESWMIPEVYIPDDVSRKCNLFAFQDNLFFEASFDKNEQKSLHKVNLDTGEIVWQTQLEPEGPHVMTHNSNAIFFGSGITGNIVAYDVDSGSRNWARSLSWLSKNIMKYMQATPDYLFINSSPAKFHVFDAFSGKPKEWEFQLDASPIFYVDNNMIYHKEIDTHLLATNRETGNTIWEVGFNDPVLISPIFTEEFVIVKTGKLGMGQIYVLDRDTGKIELHLPPGKIDWDNPANIVGNVVEDNGYLFFMTFDAQLQAINAETGELLRLAQFTPSFQELHNSDRVNSEFCVAASDNIIIVYLGSGRQLFTFRFLPDK